MNVSVDASYQGPSYRISNHITSRMGDEILTYPFLNVNGCTAEIKELICNYVPQFLMDVITYPYWD